MKMTTWVAAATAGLMVTLTACGGKSGGAYGPAAPTQNTGTAGSGSSGSSSSAPVAATVTISSGGVSPKTVPIEPGQRVMFVNQDSKAHDIESDPHPVHTDCPATNAVGLLQPGASRATGDFTAMRNCGFHDHTDPENATWRGTIQVGTTQMPDPGYAR